MPLFRVPALRPRESVRAPSPSEIPHSATGLALLLAFLAASAAFAQMPAGPNRPIGVPEGYVITPFGYFHPSCVRRLAEGDTLVEDGLAVQRANGTLENFPACEYPHYAPNGAIAVEGFAGLEPPAIAHDWVEDASTTTTDSYGELTAIWTVPPAPTSEDGQTVYFFPGFEQTGATTTILQPVAGWNADFKNAWGMASWNCCPKGTTNESTPKTVNPGDEIKGFIQQACSAGTPSCKTWGVTTTDVTQGKATTLADTTSAGHTFNWAFAGALEVYSVSQCSDYPSNGQLTFSNVALYDYNLNQIPNPNWSKSITPDLTPACGYAAKAAATQVTLDYLPGVILKPYGTVQVSSTPPPYAIDLVNRQLAGIAAPENITITLDRKVIAQCGCPSPPCVIFDRNDTVVVSQGQKTAAFSDYAGRDPSCRNDPITTQWTITEAVLAPGVTLKLSTLPQKQLTLSAVF